MIIKKLAAPLINEKILQEAEQCYIATASISEGAFDFIKSRLHPKCKMEIVTGLDVTTSPNVLKRIWRHYQDRIALHIYTRNFFHANVYIFDLPYRKAVAFVGSGHFSLQGLKDHEEIFYKIKDPKEIEALKSWFTGYYEFAEPLTESIVTEYEDIYPVLKRHEIAMRQEKNQFSELTAAGFQWDAIKFKNQYFKKEDFLVIAGAKATSTQPEILAERAGARNKLFELFEKIKPELLKFDNSMLVDSPYGSDWEPQQHTNPRINALWITCSTGNILQELGAYPMVPGQLSFLQIRIVLKPKEISIWLLPSKDDRLSFNEQMNDAEKCSSLFKLMLSLKLESAANEYWIETAGEKRTAANFQNEEMFGVFVKSDLFMHYPFTIGKTYAPGATEITTDIISTTLQKDLEKLMLMYHYFRKVPS